MDHAELPLNQLPTELNKVWEYWRDQGGETLDCSWKKFDLLALPLHLLPTTLVVDVFADMSQNRYRFWGTRMTEIYGRDMTGRCPYDVPSEELAAVFRKMHSKTMHVKTPSATTYEFIRDNGVLHMHHTLRLPLSEDGKTVSQIVVVIEIIKTSKNV